MDIADFLKGHSFYPKASPPHVDCEGMRSLEDHLWHLAEVFRSMAPHESEWGAEARRDFSRVPQWLELAAGLRYVDIDPNYGAERSLCGTAADFQDAHASTASTYVTEQTRLLYTWNAVERFLRSLDLPPAPEAPGRFNAATQRLKENWELRPPLPHFECVVRHLEMDLSRDLELRGEFTLERALKGEPWRGRSGFALAFAHQLRHLPAHGDLDIPEPAGTWDTPGTTPADHIKDLLHPPRHAVRGLALSLQMLVSAEEEILFLTNDRSSPPEGWWIREENGDWLRDQDPPLKCLAEQAHLRPPSHEWSWSEDED